MQINPFQGKSGRWVFLSPSSGLSPRGIVAVSASEFVKMCFFVCWSLVGLVDPSPFGFQSYMVWGLISQVQVLKVVVPSVGLKPFTRRGEAGGFWVPSRLWVVALGDGVYGKMHLSLSYPFWSGVFLFAWCIGATQLVWGFFFQRKLFHMWL